MMIKVYCAKSFSVKTVSRVSDCSCARTGRSALYQGSRYPAAAFRHRRGGKDDCMPGNRRGSKARAALIEHNLRLVVYIAKKFDNTSVGVEDLISIGTIGLIKSH